MLPLGVAAQRRSAAALGKVKPSPHPRADRSRARPLPRASLILVTRRTEPEFGPGRRALFGERIGKYRDRFPKQVEDHSLKCPPH
jgi:hypothetical protein